MDGFETLRKRIQELSDTTAQSLISNAEQERDAILTEAKAEAARIKADHEERLKRAEQERAIQRRAISRLDQRRSRLRVKQELLQDTMSKALAALKAYDPKQREALYSRWLAGAEVKDETILIDKHDAPWFKDYLAKAYPELQVEVDEDVDGGFILKKDKTWQDFRFDSLLKQQETRYLQTAANILFPEQEKGDEADA